MERYSKLIRAFFRTQVNINNEFQEKAFPTLTKQEIEVNVSDNLCQYIATMAVTNPNTYELKRHVLYASFLAVQLFSDLYRNAVYYQKCCENNVLVNIVNELLSSISDVSDMEGIARVLNDTKAGRLAYLASLEFDNLSVYNKVLRIKALTIEDVEYLKKLNPFFEEEYDTYNVEVNSEFFIRQIGKWQKIFKDDIDKSYTDAVNFLLDYRKLDSDTAYNLISSIVNDYGNNEYSDEKDRLKAALVNFYSNSKDKRLTK